MKASMLCTTVYDKPGTPLTAPVPSRLCDPALAQRSYQQWLEYAAMADQFGFDWVFPGAHPSPTHSHCLRRRSCADY